MKRLLATALIAAGIVSIPSTADARRDSSVDICRRYTHSGAGPCVWWDDYQRNGRHSSLIVKSSGTDITMISDGEARRLFKSALRDKADTGKGSGPFEDRINVCHDQVGSSGSSLPCVFDTTIYGVGRDNLPVLVHSSGRREFISFERARELTLVVAYR